LTRRAWRNCLTICRAGQKRGGKAARRWC